MSSTDFELDDNYADDDVNFDESSSKISAKESDGSMMKLLNQIIESLTIL